MEFYAPWCGHCQNLKPAYEKAAKNLEGLAHVAAIDCDEDVNKPLCGQMGIQGFPTLKIIRPGRKRGKPRVEDYQGPRTASGIVQAVVEKINNHVKRVTDDDADEFLRGDEPKALLFTEKGTTSALLKSLAIDFLDVIKIGQVRDKDEKTVEKFGVKTFPTLVLIPGGEKEPVVYGGEMKKPALTEFLSQAGTPNPDPPATGKKQKKDEGAKATKPKPKPKDTSSEDPKTSSEEKEPTETVKAPVVIESAPPVPTLHTTEKLVKQCLTEKSNTCVLAFVPEAETEKGKHALDNLAELAHKHAKRGRQLFPFFAVPASNPAVADLLKSLDLTGEVELIALNARRGWWRRYEGDSFGHEGIESWIDAIRMSEGVKKKLPEGLIAIAVEDNSSEAAPEASSAATPSATDAVASEDATPVTPKADAEASSEAGESSSTKGAEPTPEVETAADHDEL